MSNLNTSAYKTLNWPEYNKVRKRRGSLTIWFGPKMACAAKPTGKRGRQPVCSYASVQTGLMMKVLVSTALRHTTGFAESLLCRVGLDWDVPDFSTLSRRQKTLAVDIPHRGPQAPLHLLIDIEPVSATGSSEPARGIRGECEGEWNARKHGGTRRRVGCKIYLGIDEKTLEVRAVEITKSGVGDAPMPPKPLAQSPGDQDIASVTANSACDTRKRHDAIAERGAAAVIPPRKTAKPLKTATAGAVARNKALRASKYPGCALWRRWSGYHRRSRVETKLHCGKLPGQRLMARDFGRQVAEFRIRVALLNGFAALGIPVATVVEQVCPGEGEVRPSADLCNRASDRGEQKGAQSDGNRPSGGTQGRAAQVTPSGVKAKLHWHRAIAQIIVANGEMTDAARRP